MLTEKNNKLKIINSISWLILVGVTLAAYSMPLIQNNVLTMQTKYPGPLAG
ncbi:MAG: hypothetical protein GX833_01430, partial [Clostridium sp.]|nr:hypothetical protein [Clostridium sp.]